MRYEDLLTREEPCIQTHYSEGTYVMGGNNDQMENFVDVFGSLLDFCALLACLFFNGHGPFALQVAQVVLDSLYKAMLNMRLRRKFVYSNDKVNSDSQHQ